VREREDGNRTREAGNRDEVEGVVASTLNAFRGGAAGFIDWLDLIMMLLRLLHQGATDRELDSWLCSRHPPDPNKCERYYD